MGFEKGLIGLNAANRAMEVLGNNIANVGTVGFKAGNVQFSDVFSGSTSGGEEDSLGVGTRFSQGSITTTNNPLDIAIKGSGFFRLSDAGTISYTRNGQFHLDQGGYVVNNTGLRLTGYLADASGSIAVTAPNEIRISSAEIAPQPTATSAVVLNLDSRASVPATATYSSTDPTSYTSATSVTLFDSNGNSHRMAINFRKTATANAWDAYATLNGTNIDIGAGAGSPLRLTFGSGGTLTTTMPTNVTVNLSNGAITPQTFTLDLTGSTQFGSDFVVNSIKQDGYASGHLMGVNVVDAGIVQGRYSNGQTKNLAQIVLTNFANPEGLQSLGGTRWVETAQSGARVIGVPGDGGVGMLQAGAVEEANVDLTAELVRMITLQRAYQANAQSIKTQDALAQTMLNLH